MINCNDFDYTALNKYKIQKRKRGNCKTGNQSRYLDCVCAFDIETTRIPEIEQTVMYIWQFQIDEDFTVYGRTWEQFKGFCDSLLESIAEGSTLCIYVHNLSYEFQFLRGVFDFAEDDVFCTDFRKILKCFLYGRRLEFRDSYIQTNMSLHKFLKSMNVKHQKLQDFEYTTARYPWTDMTDEELEYCQNDVFGLVEAIKAEMQRDNDNLYTIPLTSTGYVRRDVKKAMNSISRYYVQNIVPDYDTYTLLSEAFRGGNTHSNRYHTGEILHDVHSYDRSSSYPDVLVNCEFPIRRFFHAGGMSYDRLVDEIINTRHKAVLFRCSVYDLDLSDQFYGCPYLSKNKCRKIINGVFDNGRIISASYLETTLTDVDLSIMQDVYTFTMIPTDVYFSTYGRLPQPLIDETIKFYRIKTELKGIPGEDNKLNYALNKAKLNSIYGMCVTNPCKADILFRGDGFYESTDTPYPEILAKSNRKAFVAYQWGVWISALARLRLHEAIKLAHSDEAEFIYCDTDSVKYQGHINWTAYNAQRIADSQANGAYATDAQGITHYMGVFEPEDDYSEFCTLGAKKYVGRVNGKLECTIAGVNKKLGAEELEKAGGISAFKEGFIFTSAGGLEAIYNDAPEIQEYTVDGHHLPITANVTLRPSTYTLGVTGEYEKLLKLSREELDRLLRKW